MTGAELDARLSALNSNRAELFFCSIEPTWGEPLGGLGFRGDCGWGGVAQAFGAVEGLVREWDSPDAPMMLRTAKMDGWCGCPTMPDEDFCCERASDWVNEGMLGLVFSDGSRVAKLPSGQAWAEGKEPDAAWMEKGGCPENARTLDLALLAAEVLGFEPEDVTQRGALPPAEERIVNYDADGNVSWPLKELREKLRLTTPLELPDWVLLKCSLADDPEKVVLEWAGAQ